ncbi:MAG: hypothetical protein H6729_06820 [Deltaproteobacteria bacterium]|nr:hypothetical protein [Deltaproteobacteria bacterium]
MTRRRVGPHDAPSRSRAQKPTSAKAAHGLRVEAPDDGGSDPDPQPGHKSELQPRVGEPSPTTLSGAPMVELAPTSLHGLAPGIAATPSAARHEGGKSGSDAFSPEVLEQILGDPSVPGARLTGFGAFGVARHLAVLLVRARAERSRAEVVKLAVERLIEIGVSERERVRRILFEMERLPIVDIHPLEIMVELLETRPDLLAEVAFGEVIQNKPTLSAQVFQVGETIDVWVPLNARLKAFAIEGGGGSPGYCFAPGPPARYALEIASPGVFKVLVRAEIRKKHYLDAVSVRVDG